MSWTLSVAPSLELPFPSLMDYAVGNGVADDTAAFNSFLADAQDAGRGYVPRNRYRLTSQPNDITRAFTLFGDSKMQSILLRDYNGTSGKGVLHFEGGDTTGTNYNTNLGMVVKDIGIIGETGTSGGYGIAFVATSTTQWNRAIVDGLTVTGNANNCFDCCFYVDGSLMTTGAQGNRVFTGVNLDIFGANGYSMILKSVVGGQFTGELSTSGGTHANSGSIQIGGTSTVPSSAISIDMQVINGKIDLDRVNGANISVGKLGDVSGVSVANTGNTVGIRGSGQKNGSVQSNWSDSSWV